MTPGAPRCFSHLVVPGLHMWFVVLMGPSLTRLDPSYREGPKHSQCCASTRADVPKMSVGEPGYGSGSSRSQKDESSQCPKLPSTHGLSPSVPRVA